MTRQASAPIAAHAKVSKPTHKGKVSPLCGHPEHVFEQTMIPSHPPRLEEHQRLLPYRLRTITVSHCRPYPDPLADRRVQRGILLTALLSRTCCDTRTRLARPVLGGSPPEILPGSADPCRDVSNATLGAVGAGRFPKISSSSSLLPLPIPFSTLRTPGVMSGASSSTRSSGRVCADADADADAMAMTSTEDCLPRAG